MSKCKGLRGVIIREPTRALTLVMIIGCMSLTTLPDLINFPRLESLEVNRCGGKLRFSISEPLHSLKFLGLENCEWNGGDGIEELPDLGLFPALITLKLDRCIKLTSLKSSLPLLALRDVDVTGCTSLT